MRRRAGVARAAVLATVTVTVTLAGCFGGRRSASPPPGVTPSDAPAGDTTGARVPPGIVRPDSTGVVPDSSARDSTTRDSLVTDSIARAAAPRDSADSAAVGRDSTAAPATPAKPTKRDCVLDFSLSPPESRFVTNLLNDSTRTSFIGGGLVAQCQGDPQTVRADSAEQYESAGILQLIGNVVFEEPGKIRMTAPNATYFTGEEKLVAYGGVVATELETGSTFSGPTMEYYRAGSRRPFSRLYAPQRPSARLVEKDSNGVERPPITITANQMEDVGDTVLVAWGDVTINREQIVGSGDSSTFDKRSEKARLIRNAVISSRDTAQPFRLAGDSIDMFSTNRVMERVVAMHRASATSNDVSMRAERVEMHLDSQRVDKAWAFGPGRAYAETSTQTLEADSLEILMPGQIVQALHAVGRALAVTTPDTARIRNPEEDVLAGDTIIALFDTATTAPDTTPKSTIHEVTAILRASARYQLPSSRGPTCPPGINYVRGAKIVVSFDSGAVKTVEVEEEASGVYLEPVPDSLDPSGTLRCTVPADSLGADSLGASARDSAQDTVRVVPPPPDTLHATATPAFRRTARVAHTPAPRRAPDTPAAAFRSVAIRTLHPHDE